MDKIFKSVLETLGSRFLVPFFLPALLLVSGVVLKEDLLQIPQVLLEPENILNIFNNLAITADFWLWVTLVVLLLAAFNESLVQLWAGEFLMALLHRGRELFRLCTPEGPLEQWRRRALEVGGQRYTRLILAPEAGQDLSLWRKALARLWSNGGLGLPLEREMPTALGRIREQMRTAPVERYGIDGSEMWSRLLLLLPEGLVDQYRTGKTWRDLYLNLATCSVLLGLRALAWVSAKTLQSLGTMTFFLLLAYLFYRAALGPAHVMRRAFETAFDLHRGKLLEAWGLDKPVTIAAEKRIWQQLSHFLHWSEPCLFPEESRKSPQVDVAETT